MMVSSKEFVTLPGVIPGDGGRAECSVRALKAKPCMSAMMANTGWHGAGRKHLR